MDGLLASPNWEGYIKKSTSSGKSIKEYVGDLISESDRISFMSQLGFSDAGMDYGMHLNYKTDALYVGDLNEFNVIKGETGINVIDADCRLNVPTLECGGHYEIAWPIMDFSSPFHDWILTK